MKKTKLAKALKAYYDACKRPHPYRPHEGDAMEVIAALNANARFVLDDVSDAQFEYCWVWDQDGGWRWGSVARHIHDT
jgi:hypothetical protein